MPVIILFMFALYISRYHSVRNTFSMNMYFLLTFLLTISPRKSTQSVHQIVQFQSQKCKSSFDWEGGTPPSQNPPPARALRALACVFPTILQILPPHEKIPAYGLARGTKRTTLPQCTSPICRCKMRRKQVRFHTSYSFIPQNTSSLFLILLT